MPKRIVILGNAASVHIVRWATGIARAGYDIHLISLSGKPIEGISTTIIGHGAFRRLAYLTNLSKVKKLIKSLNPNILHSHYATGYGLWGAFSRLHPHIISVWGSDIIDFPRSYLRRIFLRKILLSAENITATSHFLKSRTDLLIPDRKNEIAVVPFGVNLPDRKLPRKPDNLIRLVFIKGHRRKYGPDILLQAVKIVAEKMPNIRLTMAGEGELTEELKLTTHQLALDGIVIFTGFIDNKKISSFLAEHDIMVMPSVMESESFGVAALEASAAGLPVIASRIGGIPEVVKESETGLLVPAGDPQALAGAIIELASNADRREKMGTAGRKFVAENYRWDDNIKQMIAVYEKAMNKD